jgi:hypothetical protein
VHSKKKTTKPQAFPSTTDQHHTKLILPPTTPWTFHTTPSGAIFLRLVEPLRCHHHEDELFALLELHLVTEDRVNSIKSSTVLEEKWTVYQNPKQLGRFSIRKCES